MRKKKLRSNKFRALLGLLVVVLLIFTFYITSNYNYFRAATLAQSVSNSATISYCSQSTLSLCNLSSNLLMAQSNTVVTSLGSTPIPAPAPSVFSRTINFVSAPGPLDNPLKGWAPTNGSGLSRPTSMAFIYVPWKDLESAENVFSFDQWESTWRSDIANKHIVFRVYIDYPGRATGMPQWLVDKLRSAGVPLDGANDGMGFKAGGGYDTKNSWNTADHVPGSGEWSPPYDHPIMLQAMKEMVAALGARYDSDPRIAFVQIGFLGQFGEETTYRLGPETRFSLSTQRAVYENMHQAFPHKILLSRSATTTSTSSVSVGGDYPWVGYHDDMLTFQTEDKMLPAILAKGRGDNWKLAAMGGEFWPSRRLSAVLGPYTDLVIDSQDNTKMRSLSQPFTNGDKGKYNDLTGTSWKITGGTGFTQQIVKITSVDANGVAKIDKPLGTRGATGGKMQYQDRAKTPAYWNSLFDHSKESIKQFHLSMAGPANPATVTGLTSTQSNQADELVRLMGYQFRLSSLKIPNTINAGESNSVTLNVTNEGVAPFYYPWPVKLGIFQNNVLKQTITTNWDVRTWLPGAVTQSTSFVSNLPTGQYDLKIIIEDPWSNASKKGIQFANTNVFSNGWTTLTSFQLNPKPAVKLTKSVDKTMAKSGDILTYTLKYDNSSSKTLSKVIIKDKIPTETTYVSYSATKSGVQSGYYVVWNLGYIPAYGKGQVSFKVKIK